MNAGMSDTLDLIRSAVAGMAWPAVPDNTGARALAMQFQLDQSQWWSPQALAHHQMRQLRLLLRHAAASVPYYRDCFARVGINADSDFAVEDFQRLPVLTRGNVQEAATALYSTACPQEHGAQMEGQSGGSTGTPIHFRGTELNNLLWHAFTMRDHLWHGRDFGGKLAAIRARVGADTLPGWGLPVDAVFRSGPAKTLDVASDVETQLDWLMREAPDYLLTYPSNLMSLLRVARRRSLQLSRLREVRTFGEAVAPELRKLCREVWQVPLVDVYSAEEVGNIALQCPQNTSYHIQSENLLVEVLDEAGVACEEGCAGLVVVTTLHNYAMPLIRYAIGDFAVRGAACPCGRGLPVLASINGRRRNMLRLPDGSTHWPFFGFQDWIYDMPVRQVQFVQTALDCIEVRMVAARELNALAVGQMTRALRASLGYPFVIAVRYVQQIKRSPLHKYEDFVSELA